MRTADASKGQGAHFSAAWVSVLTIRGDAVEFQGSGQLVAFGYASLGIPSCCAASFFSSTLVGMANASKCC